MENNFTLPKMRLKAEQAAEYLCISFSLLEKMRSRGDGPTYAKLGRAIVYEVADLDSWVNSKKRNSTLDSPRSIDAPSPR